MKRWRVRTEEEDAEEVEKAAGKDAEVEAEEEREGEGVSLGPRGAMPCAPAFLLALLPLGAWLGRVRAWEGRAEGEGGVEGSLGCWGGARRRWSAAMRCGAEQEEVGVILRMPLHHQTRVRSQPGIPPPLPT